MLYRHFEIMKSISGGIPHVETVSFGIDSKLDDFASLIKE